MKPIYEFGAFRLDPADRLLVRDGKPVPLTPKAFDLLVYLVERRGRLAEKNALISALWPDTIVEEANLAFQISALRKVLDEGRDGESVIQTVPTKGYRFVAPVRVPPHREPRHRTVPLVVTGAVVVVSLVGLFVWIYFVRPPVTAPTTTIGSAPRIVPVTTLTGWEDWPSFAPDGQQVAFEWAGEKDDNSDIYITIIGTREIRRVTTNPAIDSAPSWSPDGRYIAFLRAEAGGFRIHLVSPLGGPDRTLSDFPAWGRISWSPDAQFVVAGRLDENARARGIYAIPAEGGEPRAITTARFPTDQFAPAFSSDGRRLVYVACALTDVTLLPFDCHIEVVDVDDRLVPTAAPRRLTVEPMATLGAPTWSRDGRSVIFFGRGEFARSDSSSGHDHLWRVPLDGSRLPDRIDAAGMNARRATTSPSRDRLVFSRSDDDVDVYQFRLGHASERLVSSSFTDVHAEFSGDGRRLAFCSDRSGAFQVWIANADGSAQQQLTYGSNEKGAPRWSPDGSQIAFDAQEPDGYRHIWTIPTEGGAPHQVTGAPGDQVVPTWSHDGQWIYFSTTKEGAWNIWRVRPRGGAWEQITQSGSGPLGLESADGKELLYQLKNTPSPLVSAPLSGGPARQLVACAATFSVVGTAVYYVPCDPANAPIHRLDSVSGKDRIWAMVPEFDPTTEWDLSVSPDGASLLYDRLVNSRADLWMIENFK